MRNPDRSKERGSILVEMAIIAPLFLWLCFFTFDVSRMLLVRSALTQAAREGVRLAAGMPFLEEGHFMLRDEDGAWKTYVKSGADWVEVTGATGQQQVLWQMLALASGTIKVDIAPRSVTVESSYFAVHPTVPDRNDSVAIKVAVTYQGLFWPFAQARMQHEAVGPYL